MTYRLLGILSRSKYLAGNDRPSTGIGAMKGVALIFLIGGVGMYIAGKMMGHAVLPPVEERQKVKTAMGAARAELASEKAR